MSGQPAILDLQDLVLGGSGGQRGGSRAFRTSNSFKHFFWKPSGGRIITAIGKQGSGNLLITKNLPLSSSAVTQWPAGQQYASGSFIYNDQASSVNAAYVAGGMNIYVTENDKIEIWHETTGDALVIIYFLYVIST